MSVSDDSAFFVYITTGSEEEARRISAALLEERLVACTNLIRGMESAYRWQGKIETATECILIGKTQENCLEKLKNKVNELHSYDCPCIVAWSITEGHGPYLTWLKEEVQ